MLFCLFSPFFTYLFQNRILLYCNGFVISDCRFSITLYYYYYYFYVDQNDSTVYMAEITDRKANQRWYTDVYQTILIANTHFINTLHNS